MEMSKDWGATTTWFGFALLAASTFLLVNGNITDTSWMVVNGISTVGVAGKGITKAFKKNGAPAPPAP